MMIDRLGRRLRFGAFMPSPTKEIACAAPWVSEKGPLVGVPGIADRPNVVDAPLGGRPKRLIDVSFAIAGLVLAGPLMLLIALLMKVLDPGPVFFAHDRVGFGGRSFRCYKFRSMAVNADALLAQHLACDPEAAREWHATQKLRHDPRVSFLGKCLRRSSLDELPQLFNILLGEMSCVGPRPIVPAELERYGSSADYYLRARPGLTGLWQVSGRSSAEYATRVRLDAGYVRSWSLWADFGILCRTPRALLRFGETC
jgi:exopolysaccharide production protein ExoY